MRTDTETSREVWVAANRRMTDAALVVTRWVELHPHMSSSHKALYPLMAEFVEARRVVLDLIAADQAPAAPTQRGSLALVR